MFDRAVVLLDAEAPLGGAFRFALDLAQRLHLPIHGLEWSAGEEWALRVPRGNSGSRGMCPFERSASPTAQACAIICSEARVPWKCTNGKGRAPADFQPTLSHHDLLILGQGLTTGLSRAIERIASDSQAAMLVCPRRWAPPCRALILDPGGTSMDDYLVPAAQLCAELEMDTIVLTAGSSEATVQRRQEEARDLLARRSFSAVFDSLICEGVHSAVTSVARWRHCQVVIVPRQTNPTWWRRLRRQNHEWIKNPCEFASFLSLPAGRVSLSACLPT